MDSQDNDDILLGWSLVYAGIGILCVVFIYLIEVIIKSVL
jgi:hypothetical protein